MRLEQLGPYKIGHLLGQGGMGAVYSAVEIEGGTTAAVKVLSASLGREEGFRDRFVAEIESLRKLSHPNIVRLHGFGEEDGLHYYGMELVEGQSLEEELRAGRRFTWKEAVDIGVQICRALRHAHDRGVIHRDIKPANLLITAAGEVKLSDFGIAKLFGSTGLTSDGGVVGTADYMAPEQADGRPVTHRCDLYSLGGVLYTLLARRPPFQAKTVTEMLRLQKFADPESLRRLNAEVPVELDAIIRQLLEKDPEKRIPTAQALGRRLERVEADPQPASSPTPAPRPASGFAATMAEGQTAEAVEAAEQQQAETADAALVPALGSDDGTMPAATAAYIPRKIHVSTSADRKFTTVESERGLDLIDDGAGSWISPQTWALVAALLGIGLAVWYFLQPPTADRLYAKITAVRQRAEDTGPEALIDAADEITAFQTYYPGDPRGDELSKLRNEIDQIQLERKFERLARQAARTDSLRPVERAYLEAIQYKSLEPIVCREKLAALIKLYGGAHDAPIATQQCLQLARRQLDELDKQIAQYAADDLQVIDERISRAEELQRTDPDAARGIWEGIVVLYGEKPWAAKAVERARRELARHYAAASPDR